MFHFHVPGIFTLHKLKLHTLRSNSVIEQMPNLTHKHTCKQLCDTCLLIVDAAGMIFHFFVLEPSQITNFTEYRITDLSHSNAHKLI